MDRYVARLNIEHFKRKLAEQTDPAKREMLVRLLAEEETKLAEDRNGFEGAEESLKSGAFQRRAGKGVWVDIFHAWPRPGGPPAQHPFFDTTSAMDAKLGLNKDLLVGRPCRWRFRGPEQAGASRLRFLLIAAALLITYPALGAMWADPNCEAKLVSDDDVATFSYTDEKGTRACEVSQGADDNPIIDITCDDGSKPAVAILATGVIMFEGIILRPVREEDATCG